MPAPCSRLQPALRTFVSSCLLFSCGAAPLFAQWTPNPLSLPSPVYDAAVRGIHSNAFRFDLVLDASAGGNPVVRELVVRYR